MAYNERLAERVRQTLADRAGISERKMFGGIAFLLDGKMCVGVLNDELMVRSGTERYAEALKKTHARPMDFTGRVMTGMVYVSPTGVSRGASLRLAPADRAQSHRVACGITTRPGTIPTRSRACHATPMDSGASDPPDAAVRRYYRHTKRSWSDSCNQGHPHS